MGQNGVGILRTLGRDSQILEESREKGWGAASLRNLRGSEVSKKTTLGKVG